MTIPPVLVVDASVVLKWALSEPGRGAALLLLDAFENRETDLLAPDTLMHEVGSALSRRCRRKQLTPAQARQAWTFLEGRRPMVPTGSGLMSEALALSEEHSLSYWDCLYLALAGRNECGLVTADRRFYRGVVRGFPFVELLGE